MSEPRATACLYPAAKRSLCLCPFPQSPGRPCPRMDDITLSLSHISPLPPQVRRAQHTVHSETKYIELVVVNDHQLVSDAAQASAFLRGGGLAHPPVCGISCCA